MIQKIITEPELYSRSFLRVLVANFFAPKTLRHQGNSKLLTVQDYRPELYRHIRNIASTQQIEKFLPWRAFFRLVTTTKD